MSKIQLFTDLIVWQKAHVFVLAVYKMTKHFPKEELYGLSSQLRRAAVSITSNIAEGFYRRSKREKVQFLYISLGSVAESENQLYIARDLHYCSMVEFDFLFEKAVEIAKLITSSVSSISANY